jgi:hypothetical protein
VHARCDHWDIEKYTFACRVPYRVTYEVMTIAGRDFATIKQRSPLIPLNDQGVSNIGTLTDSKLM